MHFGRLSATMPMGSSIPLQPHPRAVEVPPEAALVCETAARSGGRVLLDWMGRFAVSSKGPSDLVTEADVASQRVIRQIVGEAFPTHAFIGEETLPELSAETAVVGSAVADDLRWMVDPLDGTSNYVHGFPAWCVSVALARGDDVLVAAIYDPLRDECFTATSGMGARLNGRSIAVSGCAQLSDALVAVSFPPQLTPESAPIADFLAVAPYVHSVRRTGSTALNLAWLACGRLDAFWVRRIACWDVAAGLLLCQEAGGVVVGFGAERSATVSLAQPAFIAAATAELAAALRGRMP